MSTALDTLIACATCSAELPITGYYKAKSTPLGRFSSCKSCIRQSNSARYHEKNPTASHRSSSRLMDTPTCAPHSMKVCTKCERTRSLDDFTIDRHQTDGLSSYCRPCKSRRPDLLTSSRRCITCTAEFTPRLDTQQCCSKRCRTLDDTRRGLTPTWNSDKNRAARHGVAYEPVNRVAIFDRDDWTCGICTQAIEPQQTYPHPMSASLDHIAPLARGGAHVATNCQAAHLRCNQSKGQA